MAGLEALTDDMILTRGQPFVHYYGATDPLPEETTATLKIYGRDMKTLLGTYPAVLVEAGGVQFQIDAADVDDIPDSSRYRLYLTYPSTPAVCWYRGLVWRRD